jgi:hypothetical protein
MDIAKIVEELKGERQQIEEAVQDLEELALGRRYRRARMPPGGSEQPPPSTTPAAAAVSVPRPKPKLPPTAAALRGRRRCQPVYFVLDQREGQTAEDLKADVIYMQDAAIGVGGTFRGIQDGGHSSSISPSGTAENSWHGLSYHIVFTFPVEVDIEPVIALLREQLSQRGQLFGTVGAGDPFGTVGLMLNRRGRPPGPPNEPLPPAAAMGVPRPQNGLVRAVSRRRAGSTRRLR